MAFGYKHNRSRSSRKELISNINITPFVDIVLVLLIIFMVTSPMLNNGYNVNLPKVVSNKISINRKEQIIFTVDKAGKIRVGDNIISIGGITNYLKSYDADASQVFIKGDKSTDYGTVMSLMGVVHKNGFNNISLVTDTIKQ